MMIDEVQAPPTPQLVKDSQTKLFTQFMLIYLLILLTGWLNHLGQPIIAELEPDPAVIHHLPYEVGHLP